MATAVQPPAAVPVATPPPLAGPRAHTDGVEARQGVTLRRPTQSDRSGKGVCKADGWGDVNRNRHSRSGHYVLAFHCATSEVLVSTRVSSNAALSRSADTAHDDPAAVSAVPSGGAS